MLITAAPANSDTTDGSGTAVASVAPCVPEFERFAAIDEFAKAKVIAIEAQCVFMRGIPYFPDALFGKFPVKSQSHSRPLFVSNAFHRIARRAKILELPSGKKPTARPAKNAKKRN